LLWLESSFYGRTTGILTKFCGHVTFGAAFGNTNSLCQSPGFGLGQGKFLKTLCWAGLRTTCTESAEVAVISQRPTFATTPLHPTHAANGATTCAA
jgi:hypothetical protein